MKFGSRGTVKITYAPTIMQRLSMTAMWPSYRVLWVQSSPSWAGPNPVKIRTATIHFRCGCGLIYHSNRWANCGSHIYMPSGRPLHQQKHNDWWVVMQSCGSGCSFHMLWGAPHLWWEPHFLRPRDSRRGRIGSNSPGTTGIWRVPVAMHRSLCCSAIFAPIPAIYIMCIYIYLHIYNTICILCIYTYTMFYTYVYIYIRYMHTPYVYMYMHICISVYIYVKWQHDLPDVLCMPSGWPQKKWFFRMPIWRAKGERFGRRGGNVVKTYSGHPAINDIEYGIIHDYHGIKRSFTMIEPQKYGVTLW
jgi:hypothetical protein